MEIERKFLVDHDAWERVSKPKGQSVIQAYLTNEVEKTIRLRVKGNEAFITITGKQSGISRPEYEYPIPVNEAQEMIQLFANRTISKTRYEIVVDQHTWEVDVFHNKLNGLILAEIELTSEDEEFTLPQWVTKEVSEDPNYLNAQLIHLPSWSGKN